MAMASAGRLPSAAGVGVSFLPQPANADMSRRRIMLRKISRFMGGSLGWVIG